jgi:hypothetical protein
VFLAGPYKGSQLSLVTSIPAVAGPYDLGNVTVRAAIAVDRVTAQVTAVSDPFPTIFGGVPVRLRSALISLDRPNFTLNPTNCDPFSVDSRLFGSEGAEVVRESHFQVANCNVLPYHPQLGIKLTGGVNRLGHPAIHATLGTVQGEANSHRVSVTLPRGELLDNSHIKTICTRPQFAQEACPSGSMIGTAEATTPLLDQPLKGFAYLRSSSHKLPDLVVDLRGQIHIEAAARVDSVDSRLRTTFETIPDVPIGTFTLDLNGGQKGLVQNSKSLCPEKKQATARMTGQSGTTITEKVPLQTSCGSQQRHRRHSGHAQRRGAAK